MRFTRKTARGVSFPLILFVCLAFCGMANAQELDLVKLDREINNLLLHKDFAAVARELKSETATTVPALLRQLIIYSRAGHREQVRQTLARLADAQDWRLFQESGSADAQTVRSRVRSTTTDDFAAARIYYDRLCPHDVEGAEAFISLWEQRGDPKELDGWLAAHAAANDEWFDYHLYRRGKQGTAGELLDALAAEVKANPEDPKLVARYLRGNTAAGRLQNVAWLADTVPLHTAFEYLEFGQRLQPFSAAAAAPLFEKSLTLPFTEMDAKRIEEPLRFRQTSIIPANWNREKQLRYWAKSNLARAYQSMNRAADAQATIEELYKTPTDDIIAEDLNQLAGRVQSVSGGRAVEAKLLNDESSRRKTAEYWTARAQYYSGREEDGLEEDTFKQGLVALPFIAQDEKAWRERYRVLWFYCHFLEHRAEQSNSGRAGLQALLESEFARAQPEHPFAFEVANLIARTDFELDELRESLLRKQPDLLVRLLSARAVWTHIDEYVVEGFVRGESFTHEEKVRVLSSLEKLVTDPASSRAYVLGRMFVAVAPQRAIPLLVAHLERAGDELTLRSLLRAYCDTGDWQAAEKTLFDQRDIRGISLPAELGSIALTAANQGATDQALRLWSLKAKLNRNDLDGLEWLARTKAKSLLREFYVQMKKDDPQSATPDAALQILDNKP